MTEIDHVLMIMEFSDEQKKTIIDCTGTICRLMAKSESFLRSVLKSMANELLIFQAWYKNYNKTEKEKDLKIYQGGLE